MAQGTVDSRKIFLRLSYSAVRSFSPGGTATNISRAPTSTPAALGSKTGRSSKHIPFRRRRRLGFGVLAFPFTFCCCNACCCLPTLLPF